jgi:arsenate reductase
MAEGWTKKLKRDSIEPYSAGIEPRGLDPIAVKVMAEVGIDISNNRSKHLDGFKNVIFDFVITVCDHAYEHCPIFPGKTKVVHLGFDDPPRLAAGINDEQKVLSIYRRVRDEIKAFVQRLPEILRK